VDPDSIAHVAVKNLGNGRHNPLLWRGQQVGIRDVLGSPVLADPVHELEACAVSDGACALFLATRSAANRFPGRPVWLRGFGHTVEAYHLGDRDLARSAALEASARKAYRMAGISNPTREVDLVELTEYYAYQELLWTEALGLCEAGRGREILEKGITARQGAIPVNASGGVLSGKPLVVAGMSAVADVVAQLRGEAGPTQTDSPRVGLVQAASGICGQGQTVLIFSTEGKS
jgi:acetyl-CoA C-acetyltransferase